MSLKLIAFINDKENKYYLDQKKFIEFIEKYSDFPGNEEDHPKIIKDAIKRQEDRIQDIKADLEKQQNKLKMIKEEMQ